MENLEIKSKQKDDVKSKINDVNKQLELQKNNLNKLDASEEQLSAVHKKIEKCIDTMSQAIKGQKINNKFREILDNNDFSRKNLRNSFDMKRQEINRDIQHSYDELEKLEKINKDNN